MDLQQVYCYEFRLRTPHTDVEDTPELRFLVGVFNAAFVSVPLWLLIVWGIKSLLA